METTALVSVVGTVAVSIIAQLQNSRCTHIECCGVSCDRDVADGEVKRPGGEQTQRARDSSSRAADSEPGS